MTDESSAFETLSPEDDPRSAFITGAASGIGLAVARRLASEGFRLHLVDRDADALEEASDRLRPHVLTAHVVDIRDADAVESAARQVIASGGGPSVVVNNAAAGRAVSLLATTRETWDLVLSVNLTGPYLVCRSLLGSMIERGGGVIVNIASAAALMGLPDRFAYSVTKAGLLGFTRSIARDYAHAGIRCNAICPGTVDTPWNRRILEAADDPESLEAEMSHRSLDGRMGRPEEVAGGVAFLAGPDGRFMNGSVMVMDGGMTIA